MWRVSLFSQNTTVCYSSAGSLSLFPFDLLYQRVVTEVNNHVAIYLLPLGNILMMIVSKWMQSLRHDLPDSLFLRLNITPLLFICTLGPELIFKVHWVQYLSSSHKMFTLIVLVNVVWRYCSYLRIYAVWMFILDYNSCHSLYNHRDV